MANKRTRESAQARLRDLDDGLVRLKVLCHLGGLAADGLLGLHESPAATAFSAYFTLLATEIETLREGCGGGE